MNLYENFIVNLNEASEIEKKTQEYKDYIEEHRANVKKAWNYIKELDNPYIQNNIDAISKNIENHDLDKYQDDLFEPYRKKYFPINDEESNEMIDIIDDVFKIHYSRNPHHWEYWLDDDGDLNELMHNDEEIDNDVMIAYIEMLCDWCSFGLKQDNPKEVRDWYISHKPTMVLFPKEQEIIEELLKEYCDLFEEE
jgi:adenosyl cobinamide kinase/adenosyl cobinamide phosphate guanylyltransferase